MQKKLQVTLITPAARGSRAGNRATATRWASLLQALGCQVQIMASDDNPIPPGNQRPPPDLVVALHAWRSHAAICAWHKAYPTCPLVVVLTGTDVYRFQYSHPETVYESLKTADALIGLHDCLVNDVPEAFHRRLHIVHQSALPLPAQAPRSRQRFFEVLVAGHLREEKDSLRTAYAVRQLPRPSRIRVIQLGSALTPSWAQSAEEEMSRNPRYLWLRDQPRWKVRQWMARAQVMVISSRMEGGANVVSEACVAGLPVIASDIPGNRGLLGDHYAGYFPVADTEALRERLLRAEQDPTFIDVLRKQVQARAPLFRPEAERNALRRVMEACGLSVNRIQDS